MNDLEMDPKDHCVLKRNKDEFTGSILDPLFYRG
jgi:hypothetical protein